MSKLIHSPGSVTGFKTQAVVVRHFRGQPRLRVLQLCSGGSERPRLLQQLSLEASGGSGLSGSSFPQPLPLLVGVRLSSREVGVRLQCLEQLPDHREDTGALPAEPRRQLRRQGRQTGGGGGGGGALGVFAVVLQRGGGGGGGGGRDTGLSEALESGVENGEHLLPGHLQVRLGGTGHVSLVRQRLLGLF